jgi:hypothetical protein
MIFEKPKDNAEMTARVGHEGTELTNVEGVREAVGPPSDE